MDTLIALTGAWLIQRTQSQYLHINIDLATAPLTATILLFIFIKLLLYTIRTIHFNHRCKSLGCAQPAFYPHKDPILGLDILPSTLGALKAHRLLDLLRERFAQYGNTHYTLALGRWTLITCEPENIRTILSTKIEDYPIAGPRLHATLPLLGPKSVFTSNGEVWHSARAAIRPAFVRELVADLWCFDKHIYNMLARIPRDGSTFDLQVLLQAMTMDSITDFMLGYSTDMLVRPSPEAEAFLRDFEFGSMEGGRRARLGSLAFWVPNWKLNAAVRRIREYLRKYLRLAIQEKEEGRDKERYRGYVFLDELLKSGKDEDHVIDQILSIIVAGRDTTAAAMTAVFYYLARSPDAVEKVRDEVIWLGREIWDDEFPSWEQLKGMKYLNNCVREGLRLFPPLPTNSRETNKETILPTGGGPDGKQPILVPKGTPVRWSLDMMQRRTDIFGPDADEFRPERWETLRVRWEYIPFHGGPRICLGRQFALTQMAYTLYKFFKVFKSIEARDRDSPLLVKTNLTACLANGCNVAVVPVRS
ncbi:cytochrome P450 [Naviculisporaceae sp. PSN 640]